MSSNSIDLYYVPSSPPCRAVLLTAKSIGIELNLIHMKSSEGEHNEEFVKLNPQNIVPTIVDNGFVLWESRAIMTYLVTKYGKNDFLYPSNPEKRATVDRMLYFDMGTLYQRYLDYYYPAYFKNASFEPYHARRVDEVFSLFDTLLKGTNYAAGTELTVADLSLVATVSTYEVSGFDLSRFPNVSKWYNLIRASAPGYEEADGKNVLIYRQIIGYIMQKRAKGGNKDVDEKKEGN